ncbi:MAG: hypothetical protein Q4A17_03440 [Thermoguttaceae bacterium]|nr:hypothetical protein [Thermoguttaceae bacterium]
MSFRQLEYQKEYVLPVATRTAIGGIAVDGDLFSVNANSNRLELDPVELMTQTLVSVQIGGNATVSMTNDIAIGNGSSAYGAMGTFYDYPALAVGHNAIAGGASSIQLGPGSNITSSLSVGFKTSSVTANYTLLNLDGMIPYQRLPIADTNVGAVKADGTTITISSGVISAADQLNGVKTSTNSGKFLKINAQGEVVAESLTVYNGGVN